MPLQPAILPRVPVQQAFNRRFSRGAAPIFEKSVCLYIIIHFIWTSLTLVKHYSLARALTGKMLLYLSTYIHFWEQRIPQPLPPHSSALCLRKKSYWEFASRKLFNNCLYSIYLFFWGEIITNAICGLFPNFVYFISESYYCFEPM